MSPAVPAITPRDTWIDGRGGRLFARLWSPAAPASDVPLILFHDSLGSVELWRDFPAALAAQSGRTVVAYDRLGFGRSDARRGPLPLDFIAAEADGGFADLRRQLAIGRFALFGHSVGGGMAVNCAARCGDDCVALVTVSAQAFVEARTVQGIEAARTLFADPVQVERLRRYHGDKAEWVLAAWIDSWLHPDFAAWSLRPVLPQVKCPLLAIHGADDEYGSPRHPELIGRLAGGPAQVELMADTRHLPHRERAGEVLARVAGFLQGLA
ncbi:alpha/beta fold hydrolase [Azospira restricta]|uniref:Alpha/beta fold hydrolase n=1 Tax=Azospira restricta TaxID=404405 RepID=A0A974PW03_9RHOO|nr:alpha/beta fold hydrolase [Azospira restricta]QRJ62103.1 alpha/beta fold hydrolase [Azospira restricta]